MGRGTGTFSARWGLDVLERLERRSQEAQTNKSRLAERYVDEGTRMDAHPGIVFRDGPSGRRAALAAGPDVWEVMATIRMGDASGDAAIGAAAEILTISPSQVRVAVRYYGAYPDEIDERVRRNLDEADAAEAAWEREQAALA
jgi:hypothetical protein